MTILGYTKTYTQGRSLAARFGHSFAYIVQDKENNRWRGVCYCVMI